MRRTALGAAAFLALALGLSAQNSQPRGAREPAWAPDGRRLAFSYLDRIWLSGPDGKGGKPLRPETTDIERDPSWSPDGRSLVFAADTGQAGFNLVVVPSGGGEARFLTTLQGDERWPSWTSDGRIVFSYRAGGRWRLQVIDSTGGTPKPLFGDTAGDDEQQGRVSPDGKRIAYLSDRDSDDGDRDLWVAELAPGPRDRVTRTRLVRVRGAEGFPAWAPDSSRLAFFAVREGAGGVWVVGVPEVLTPPGSPSPQAEAGPVARPPSAPPPTLVSRHGGAPAWSPDGKRLAIANLPLPDPSYNGNPERNTDEPPPLFAGAEAFRLWLVDAPLPIDSGAREIVTASPRDSQLLVAFDRVWETLRRLYYSTGPSSSRWVELKAQYRPKAQAAQDEAALESAIDAMVAEQPLIKPLVVSDRAVVVSGSPLASRAGALALERGGNIVDAAIAVSFALGVVEPDASGIGGDGMAVLYLKGMAEPIAIDYKDQVPIRATRDNPLLTAGSGDGPAAANIPGVVAGLDLLYRNHASKRIPWSELIAPAVDYAENGYELDTALPTSIAEGRRFFEKYRAAARIYLPDGKVPKAGDRFVNKDYAATLRAIAKDGAETFYRGAIARRIADDMAKNGGLITVDDLAQYRAIERRPLAGRYRDHQIYSAPPPVSTGAALIETLQILENYQRRPGATYASDADYLHYVIESWRARDQAPRIADPALFDVNLGSHLDPAHAATLFKRIDPRKAYRDRPVPPADSATRADWPWHDGVRGGRRGRQHDCRHADAEHMGRNLLCVRRSGVPLQQPSSLRRRRRAGTVPAARAVVVYERADARVQGAGSVRRSRFAAPCGRRCRQQLDSRVGLRHHPQRDRWRHGRPARDRSAAVARRPRSGRSRCEPRADRGSHSTIDPGRPDRARASLSEDRPEGRSAVRLRRCSGGRRRPASGPGRRRAATVARRGGVRPTATTPGGR